MLNRYLKTFGRHNFADYKTDITFCFFYARIVKDFESSGVSDDMVLGKDENIFCVADAQATIERLVAEPKITAYRAMKVIEVQHYLLCQCSTTPIANEVLLLSLMQYYFFFSPF